MLVAALAGCSSSHHDRGPDADSAAPTQSKPTTTNYMPNYMTGTSIGRVMTTPQGSTVYIFDMDRIGKSNCYGDCARHWPPVLASDGAALRTDVAGGAR